MLSIGLSRIQLILSLSLWRSPVDGVAGLGGMTVQAHCLSGYSHYPPPQPPAQLSPLLTELGVASVKHTIQSEPWFS